MDHQQRMHGPPALAPGTPVYDCVQELRGKVLAEPHPNGGGWFYVRYDEDAAVGRDVQFSFHNVEVGNRLEVR